MYYIGVPVFQRELLIRRNLGPGYHISQGIDEGANDCGATSVLDSISIYKLPVGVKRSEELKNSLFISNSIHRQEKVGEDDLKAAQANSMMSWDALTGAGFEVVSELYDSSSAALKGNYTDASKKQGVLSVRTASMLVNSISSFGFLDS